MPFGKRYRLVVISVERETTAPTLLGVESTCLSYATESCLAWKARGNVTVCQ